MNRIIDLKKLKEGQEGSPRADERPQISTRPNDAGKSRDHQFFVKRNERVAPAPIEDSATNANRPDAETPASIEWKTMDRPKHENAKDRIIIISILSAGFIIGGLLTQNYLFAIMMLLVALTLIMSTVKEPKEVTFAITAKGVRVESYMYEFENLKSFWVFYDPPYLKELSVESRKLLVPYIRIPLEDEDPVVIRQLLKGRIPERKHEESLIDIVARRLGLT